MAISTYTELQQMIDATLDHSLYDAQMPNLIILFESSINRRMLRVRQQETQVVLTPAGGSVTLPDDFLEWKRCTRMTPTPQNLEYVKSEFLHTLYPVGIDTGLFLPNRRALSGGFFTIEGSTLLTRPVADDSDIQLLYYAKIPALSASAPTNWLLTAYPDLYLFGSLVEASMFGKFDQRANLWKSRRDEVMAEIKQLDSASQGGAVAQRVEGWTP